MRPLRAVPVFALLTALAALVGLTSAARSLPLFVRSSGGSCDDCHSTIPRLNAAGIAFAERGYRDAPGGLARSHALPISLVGETGLRVSSSSTNPRRFSTFRSIPDASLLGNGIHAIGAFAGRFSYHVNVGVGPDDAEPRTQTAFLQLDDLVGNAALNLRVGRFDAELPFLSRSRRTTLASDLSPTTFEARGVELNGRASTLSYAAGLAFSDRRIAGGVAPRRISEPLEDSYFRLVRESGAYAVGAQMLFDRQDSNLRTLSWLQHLRAQLSASVDFPRVSVIPSYVFDRFDDRPAPGIHERHQYYLIEVLTRLDPRGRWSMTERFEHDERTRNAIDPEAHRQMEVVNLAWRAFPNAQIALEWSNADNRPAPRGQVDAYVRASW